MKKFSAKVIGTRVMVGYLNGDFARKEHKQFFRFHGKFIPYNTLFGVEKDDMVPGNTRLRGIIPA